MSQENVELVLQAYEALNGRDLDAWVALADPDIRMETTFVGHEFHGHEGAREYFREMTGVMPDLMAEVQESRSVGALVLVRVSLRGHGTGSSAPAEQVVWVATEWRNGRCIRSRSFRDEVEALEAVGLRE